MQKLKVPSTYKFCYNILPQIIEKDKKRIRLKLVNANSITLIPDGWTSLNRTEFLGLEAQLTGIFYDKEIINLGVDCDEGSSLVRLFGQLFFEESEIENPDSEGGSSDEGIWLKNVEVHNESENQPRTRSKTIQIDDSPSTSFYA
ncbi:unnamed protein product [Brachionus calyciflorus]|uniref:Uncharacterized protein n=1 Tax=Brachionus calyciflorus TaxID=104777 RepID=A0A814H6Z0_9BILA|nr:unnamed protein product [Brachionus calyciflorus]